MKKFFSLTFLSSILILSACNGDNKPKNELKEGMTYKEVIKIVRGRENNQTVNGVDEEQLESIMETGLLTPGETVKLQVIQNIIWKMTPKKKQSNLPIFNEKNKLQAKSHSF